MEEDGIAESLPVAESVSHSLHFLDTAVHAC
jgi:hypothetical protein